MRAAVLVALSLDCGLLDASAALQLCDESRLTAPSRSTSFGSVANDTFGLRHEAQTLAPSRIRRFGPVTDKALLHHQRALHHPRIKR